MPVERATRGNPSFDCAGYEYIALPSDGGPYKKQSCNVANVAKASQTGNGATCNNSIKHIAKVVKLVSLVT